MPHRRVERGRRVAPLVAAEEEVDRLLRRLAPVAAGLEEEAEAGEALGDPVHVVGERLVAFLARRRAISFSQIVSSSAARPRPSTTSAPCIWRR